MVKPTTLTKPWWVIHLFLVTCRARIPIGWCPYEPIITTVCTRLLSSARCCPHIFWTDIDTCYSATCPRHFGKWSYRFILVVNRVYKSLHVHSWLDGAACCLTKSLRSRTRAPPRTRTANYFRQHYGGLVFLRTRASGFDDDQEGGRERVTCTGGTRWL